jgi:hypothetical protein
MFRIKLFLFAFLFFVTIGHAFEKLPQESQMQQLTPIELHQFEMNEEGMFAYVQGHWEEIIMLVRSQDGTYLGVLKTDNSRVLTTTCWRCRFCGRTNSSITQVCKYCGRHGMSPR